MNGMGLGLFLKYAEGCRRYLEDRGLVSEQDKKALDSANPSIDVLRRVFYVAIPEMERIAKRLGKGNDIFSIDVLRAFYSGEHNERKFREGELACLAFPARVLECEYGRDNNNYLISLEPVTAEFWADSDLVLQPGDWAVMHRINIVEKIPEAFALGMAEKLRALGLDKTYKFPKQAIKYLKELNDAKGKCFT